MNSVSSIATSGISTAQLALGVAANNIANAQTAGYARQQVVPLWQNGGGVRASVTEAPNNPFGDYTSDLLNAKSASCPSGPAVAVAVVRSRGADRAARGRRRVAALSVRRPRRMRARLEATVLARTSRVREPLARLARDALDLMLPQRCPSCGVPAAADRALCELCLAAIVRVDRALCAQCLLEEREPHGCRQHTGAAVHAAWLFDARAQAFIHALKYGARPVLAAGHGGALAAALPARARRADLVLAMPHHAARLRERGVDASAALAEALARALPAPHLRGALVRVRATPPQAGRR